MTTAVSTASQVQEVTITTPLDVTNLESFKFAWLATKAGKFETTQKTYKNVLAILFDWLKENGVRYVDESVLTAFNNAQKSKGSATQKLYSTVTKKFFHYVCNHAGITDFTALVDTVEGNNSEVHSHAPMSEEQAKKLMAHLNDFRKNIATLKVATANIVATECGVDTGAIKFLPGDYQRVSNRQYLFTYDDGKKQRTRLSSLANRAVDCFYKTRFEILRDTLMVELMLKLGMRGIEITRLKTTSLVKRNGKFALAVRGKGRKSADDFIIVTPQLKRKIDEYLSYRNDFRAKEDTAESEKPMFPSISKRNFGGVLDVSTVQKAAMAALEVVNSDDEYFSTHNLRSTAACIALVKTGYNVEKVRQLLRHRDLSVTSRYIKDIEFWNNDSTAQIELALGD